MFFCNRPLVEQFKSVRYSLPCAHYCLYLLRNNAHEVEYKGCIQHIESHVVPGNKKFFHYAFCFKTVCLCVAVSEFKRKRKNSAEITGIIFFLKNAVHSFFKLFSAVAQNLSFCFRGKQVSPAFAFRLWICSFGKVSVAVCIKYCKAFFVLVCKNEFFVVDVTVHVVVPVLVVGNNFCYYSDFWFECAASPQVGQLPA